MQPAVGIYCHSLVRKFLNVCLACDLLEAREQALNSHDSCTVAVLQVAISVAISLCLRSRQRMSGFASKYITQQAYDGSKSATTRPELVQESAW